MERWDMRRHSLALILSAKVEIRVTSGGTSRNDSIALPFALRFVVSVARQAILSFCATHDAEQHAESGDGGHHRALFLRDLTAPGLSGVSFPSRMLGTFSAAVPSCPYRWVEGCRTCAPAETLVHVLRHTSSTVLILVYV